MIKLGKVKDFEVNTDEMKLTHVILELEDRSAEEIFGKKPKFRRIKGRIDTQLVESVRDAIKLEKSVKELRGNIERL